MSIESRVKRMRPGDKSSVEFETWKDGLLILSTCLDVLRLESTDQTGRATIERTKLGQYVFTFVVQSSHTSLK